MNSISEREWLKNYFNKREGRRQNEKGKKAKVKTESEADYAQDRLDYFTQETRSFDRSAVHQ